jgi:hypothetical protein
MSRQCCSRSLRCDGQEGDIASSSVIGAKPASTLTDYRAWKARCAALLERQGISAGVMRERDWRQLFIRGVSQSKPPSGFRSEHPPGLKS